LTLRRVLIVLTLLGLVAVSTGVGIAVAAWPRWMHWFWELEGTEGLLRRRGRRRVYRVTRPSYVTLPHGADEGLSTGIWADKYLFSLIINLYSRGWAVARW